MSLTPEAQRQVIDYYFEKPNAKAVVEDGLGSDIQDVKDFLEAVYEFLVNLHPGDDSLGVGDDPHGIAEMIDDGILEECLEKFGSRKTGDVGLGQSATTADMKAMRGIESFRSKTLNNEE